MWIANTNIGIKRIFFACVVITVLSIAAFRDFPVISYFLMGFGSCAIAVTLRTIITHGIVRRLYKFKYFKTYMEVREYITFSYKERLSHGKYLINIDNNLIYSHIRTSIHSHWPYLDSLRQTIHIKKNATAKILILGGGGASMVYNILIKYPHVHIDVVEISKQMTFIAHTYFLNTSNLKNVHWTVGDAFAYIQQCATKKSKYDLIIIDLFKTDSVESKIYSQSFGKLIKNALNSKGIIFLNYGFKPKSLATIRTGYLSKNLKLRHYLDKKNLIATNASILSKNSNLISLN